MTSMTIELPDALARDLKRANLPLQEIIELGMRELHAHPGVCGLADVMKFLAGLPSPEEIMAMKPTPAYEQRIHNLVQKSKDEGLTPEEEEEWSRYEFAEHLVGMAKLNAYGKLHPK